MKTLNLDAKQTTIAYLMMVRLVSYCKKDIDNDVKYGLTGEMLDSDKENLAIASYLKEFFRDATECILINELPF